MAGETERRCTPGRLTRSRSPGISTRPHPGEGTTRCHPCVGIDFVRARGSSGRRRWPQSRWSSARLASLPAPPPRMAEAEGAKVNIVRQGTAPKNIPANTHYFKTIQAAVERLTAGDWVLIEPGIYHEAVKVTSAQSGIWISGHEPQHGDRRRPEQNPGQRHRNLQSEQRLGWKTSRCETSTRAASDCGNEIWWNGGADSGKIGAHGW